MAPFVTQWYAALGTTESRYILYKASSCGGRMGGGLQQGLGWRSINSCRRPRCLQQTRCLFTSSCFPASLGPHACRTPRSTPCCIDVGAAALACAHARASSALATSVPAVPFCFYLLLRAMPSTASHEQHRHFSSRHLWAFSPHPHLRQPLASTHPLCWGAPPVATHCQRGCMRNCMPPLRTASALCQLFFLSCDC